MICGSCRALIRRRQCHALIKEPGVPQGQQFVSTDLDKTKQKIRTAECCGLWRHSSGSPVVEKQLGPYPQPFSTAPSDLSPKRFLASLRRFSQVAFVRGCKLARTSTGQHEASQKTGHGMMSGVKVRSLSPRSSGCFPGVLLSENFVTSGSLSDGSGNSQPGCATTTCLNSWELLDQGSVSKTE